MAAASAADWFCNLIAYHNPVSAPSAPNPIKPGRATATTIALIPCSSCENRAIALKNKRAKSRDIAHALLRSRVIMTSVPARSEAAVSRIEPLRDLGEGRPDVAETTLILLKRGPDHCCPPPAADRGGSVSRIGLAVTDPCPARFPACPRCEALKACRSQSSETAGRTPSTGCSEGLEDAPRVLRNEPDARPAFQRLGCAAT